MVAHSRANSRDFPAGCIIVAIMPSQRAVLRLVPAALAALASLDAAYAADQWHKISTSHFELYTTAGERKGREAILHFERVRDFFVKTMAKNAGTQQPVRIVGFRSEKEYQPYRMNEFATAYYSAGTDHDTIVMQGLGSELFPVAVHEYVHLLVRHSKLDLPLWLNEGFADLFSSLTPVGDKVRVGDLHPGRMAALLTNKWLTVETLTAVGHDSPHYNERDRASIFYAQSWGLVHMLNLSDGYRPKFNEFVSVLLEEGDAPGAFRKVYSKTVMDVQDDLRQYLTGNSIKVALFGVKLEKSAETPLVEMATPLESGLLLASLLVGLRKQTEAAEMYDKLAAEHPQSHEIAEGRGYLALRRERDRDEARKQFARAAELGSKNAQMYYDYASLGGGDEDTGAIPMLEKAIELRPDFKDAYYRLGFARMSARQYKEALEAFVQVKQVKAEEAVPMFQAMAMAFFETGQTEEARKAAERARKYAKTETQIRSSQQILEYVSQSEEEVQARRGRVSVARTRPQSSNDADQAPPTLQRRQGEPAAETVVENATGSTFAEPSQRVLGALTRVDCRDEEAVLHLVVQGKPLALVINDPEMVRIVGRAGGKVEFSCGPQKNVAVSVGYEPKKDEKLGTTGVVKVIEFQ